MGHRKWLSAGVMALATVAPAFVCVGAARGEEARVLVVDVAPAAAQLDPEELRALVANELRAHIVVPSDPRAPSANGTLTFDLDRTSGQLSVTYVAHANPITRHVPLPADRASAQTAAVLLAGNLARDEASELADELRKERPPTAKPAKPPPSPGAPAVDDEASPREREGIDAARALAALDYYAGQDRGSRHALGWAFMGAAAGALGAAGYLGSQSKDPSWFLVGAVGVAFAGDGLLLLLTPTRLEVLAAYGRRAGNLPALEQAWAMEAEHERSRRRFAGVGMLVAGGLALGVGAVTLADANLLANNPAGQNGFGLLFLGIGALEGALGVYTLSTDGPVESALEAFEAASGRGLRSKEAAWSHLRVTPTPGGAMAGFSLAL